MRFIIGPETDTYDDQLLVSGRAHITPSLGKLEGRGVKKGTYLHLSFFLQLLHAQYGIRGIIVGIVKSLWSG